MHIDVVIPYEPYKQLGKAYNRIMDKADDWVLFLDQDLYLCNPNWYQMCITWIENYGEQAGWITCFTNRLGHTMQIFNSAPESNDMTDHIRFAEMLWHSNGDAVTDISHMPDGMLASGFFMLTNKKVWNEVGGFADGFLGIDNDYHKKIVANGYKLLRLDGLYIYHNYSRIHELIKP